jgi:hypothetical protein
MRAWIASDRSSVMPGRTRDLVRAYWMSPVLTPSASAMTVMQAIAVSSPT